MGIEKFEDLKSLSAGRMAGWQEARKRERGVYRLTSKEGFRSDRGLVWQIQEAAVSCMGNIAEAHGRYSFENKRRFLDIALGSSKEVQSHLYVAVDQIYIAQSEVDETYHQAEVVGQLISGAIESLDRQIRRWSTERSARTRNVRRQHP